MRLRDYRRARGLTQAEVASALRRHRNTIRGWEHGICDRASRLQVRAWSAGEVDLLEELAEADANAYAGYQLDLSHAT